MYGSKEPTCPFFSVYSLTEILDAGYPDALIVCTRFCCQITWTLYNNLEMLKCRAQTRSSAFDKWLPKFGIVLTIIFRLLFCFSRMFSWKATKLGGFHPPMGQPRSNSSGLNLYRLVSIIKIASNILFLLKNKLILVNHRHRQFVPPHPFCLSHIFLSFYCFFFFFRYNLFDGDWDCSSKISWESTTGDSISLVHTENACSVTAFNSTDIRYVQDNVATTVKAMMVTSGDYWGDFDYCDSIALVGSTIAIILR